MNIIEQIIQQKNDGRKVIIYCAGLHGKLFYSVLKTCGILVDFFADMDSCKWGKDIADGIPCINPERLNEWDSIGFICVGKVYYQEIYELICREKWFEIIEISSIIDELILNNRALYFDVLRSHAKQKSADLFYDLYPNKTSIEVNAKKIDRRKEKEKVAIYTAVFGGYDSTCFPRYINHTMDYFYVSDERPRDLPVYFHWVDAGTIIPDSITSPVKRNRFIKMNPHLFLKDYVYSMYIDGNVIIKGDVSSFICKSKTGISLFMHPMRECIYYEALSIVNFKRVNVDDVCRQMNRYLEEGMPYRYGLAEMPVIVREHGKKECVDVMETWWREFDRESQRDQLSFMYALWKNNFNLNDLAILGNNVRKCEQIEFCHHVAENRDVKNDLVRN